MEFIRDRGMVSNVVIFYQVFRDSFSENRNPWPTFVQDIWGHMENNSANLPYTNVNSFETSFFMKRSKQCYSRIVLMSTHYSRKYLIIDVSELICYFMFLTPYIMNDATLMVNPCFLDLLFFFFPVLRSWRGLLLIHLVWATQMTCTIVGLS